MTVVRKDYVETEICIVVKGRLQVYKWMTRSRVPTVHGLPNLVHLFLIEKKTA